MADLCRTVPSISSLLQPLEDKIRCKFNSAITRQSTPNDALRDMLALPARHGGLAIINRVAIADMEFDVSTRLSAPLVALIIAHERALGTCQVEQKLLRIETKKMKRRREQEAAKYISERLL